MYELIKRFKKGKSIYKWGTGWLIASVVVLFIILGLSAIMLLAANSFMSSLPQTVTIDGKTDKPTDFDIAVEFKLDPNTLDKEAKDELVKGVKDVFEAERSRANDVFTCSLVLAIISGIALLFVTFGRLCFWKSVTYTLNALQLAEELTVDPAPQFNTFMVDNTRGLGIPQDCSRGNRNRNRERDRRRNRRL